MPLQEDIGKRIKICWLDCGVNKFSRGVLRDMTENLYIIKSDQGSTLDIQKSTVVFCRTTN